MENSISYWQHFLLQETEEKELSNKQQKIAKLDPPVDKIDSGDFKALRSGAKIEEDSQDHEVSMAQNSLKSIASAASQLMDKLGQEEKDIPAWIQDHISNAENYINQASKNYHEYGGQHTEEDNSSSIMETEFISLDDFSKNLERYKKGDIEKSQLITSYNRLEAEDQDKAKKLAKGLDVLPNPKKINESKIPSLYEMLRSNKNKNGYK